MVLCLGLGMLINRQHVKSSESLLSPEMMKAAARQEASVPAKTPEELQQEELRRRAAEAEAASSQASAPASAETLSPPTKGAFFLNTPAAGRRRGVCAPGLFRLLPFREQVLK